MIGDRLAPTKTRIPFDPDERKKLEKLGAVAPFREDTTQKRIAFFTRCGGDFYKPSDPSLVGRVALFPKRSLSDSGRQILKSLFG